MDTSTKKKTELPKGWVLTSQPKAGEIFAEDETGEPVIVGDLVSRKGKLYKVCDIIWDVSGDGFYEETVSLVCGNVKTGKGRTFIDNEVTLIDRPQ